MRKEKECNQTFENTAYCILKQKLEEKSDHIPFPFSYNIIINIIISHVTKKSYLFF
jgi:hypothetical protein